MHSVVNDSVDPRISIIVVAYNRKQYILNAIRSILNQDLPSNHYEIILVKNFSDEEIDSFLLENGVTNILVNDGSWGESLFTGINVSRGRIVAFLDDDDEFYPNKLSRVYEVFQTLKEVVYYHNSFELVSYKGDKLKSPLYSGQGMTKVISKHDQSGIISIFRRGLFSNLSSVAVSRELLIFNLKSIKGLQTAMDVFTFFMALDSGKKLYFDKAVLTKYYIRRQSAMHSIGDFEAFIKSGIRESNNEFEAYKSLSKKLNEDQLLQIANGIGVQWKILFDSLSENYNTSEFLKNYIYFLKQAYNIRPKYTALISLVVFLRILFGNKAKFIFFVLRTKIVIA